MHGHTNIKITILPGRDKGYFTASEYKLASDWNHTLPTVAHIYIYVCPLSYFRIKIEVQEHGYHMNFLTLANFVFIAFE